MSQSNHTHVWVQGNANISIYEEDENGVVINPDEPILEYCYSEGVTLSVGSDVQRRAVTGRGRRKLVRRSCVFDEISLSVEHFFFDKALEYDQIFVPHKQFRIKVEFFDITYQEVDNDVFNLSFSKSIQWNVSGSGAAEMNATASFEAEKFVQE